MDMREIICKNPILAIMRDVPLEKTIEYAGAVLNGGVSFFEVALNSEFALQQIAILKENYGDKIIVGAGTAVTVELAKTATAAGAEFLLAPSTDPDVLEYCAKNHISFLPGVLSPSDVSMCLRYGFNIMKMFPAGSVPLSHVKAMRGPFGNTEYVAIGGVNRENIEQFFKAGYVGVGLGSSLLPSNLVKANKWDECSEYVASMVKKVSEIRG